MNILVTGGTGFIGSHTCVELINCGHKVIIIDNLYNSSIDVVNKIEIITGVKPKFYCIDVLNYEDVNLIFKKNKIDAVIHFAGLKAVEESIRKPLDYYRNNILGLINICTAMKENKCEYIIFSSSATVYGANNGEPFIENVSISAVNPYGYTKVFSERILKDICIANKNFSVVILRYFNPIGAHESGIIGENPIGVPNNLFPYINKVAIGELPYLNIFGDDYDTVDGTGVRDYIHIVDLAKGHVKAVEYALNHKGVEIFNLGTGKGTSVLELISAYEKVTGVKINYKITSRRQGDVPICYADTKKANDILNWKAIYDINKMCKDSWNFIKKNKSF